MDLQIDGNKHPPKILIVDDEDLVLRSLARELGDLAADVIAFSEPLKALEYIQSNNADLLISDVRMPQIDGIELMERASQIQPALQRVVLTGYTEIDSVISAINRGRIHYYLEKPWDTVRLLEVVDKCLELSQLRKRNKALEELTKQQNLKLQRWNNELEEQVTKRTNQLNESYTSTVTTFASLVETRMHEHQSSSRDVMLLCLKIAKKLDLNSFSIQSLKYAALLRSIGKLGFPDDLLETPYFAQTQSQLKIYRTHPDLAAVAVSAIKPLKETAEILSTYCENFDGTGFPSGILDEKIPLTAKILSAASDFYDAIDGHLLQKRLTFEQAISWLRENKNQRYSRDVVDIAIGILTEELEDTASTKADDALVSCCGLQEGMILSKDLYSPAGVLLLSRGTELDESLINHIVKLERNGGQSLQLSIKN